MRRRLAVAAVVGLLAWAVPPAVARTKKMRRSIAAIEAAFPKHLWKDAKYIAACESSFDYMATHRNRNGSTDWGLFQLNDGGTLQSLGLTPSAALIPERNAAAAYQLYVRRGWSPWTCSRSR